MGQPRAKPKTEETDAAPAPEAKDAGLQVAQDLTPMMRQYLETKAQNPDAILFFRLGDFYEMFFEDAVRASEILQITLTARSKGADRVPMCGVPYHSARRYIARLIDQGLRVAICEQVEDPSVAKGIVRREVIRIITPGMVLDDEVLEPRSNNYLAAVHFGDERAGLSLLDASTGDFSALEVEGLDPIAEELGRSDVRELLVSEETFGTAALESLLQRLSRRPSVTKLDRAAFEPGRAAQLLKQHFQVASLQAYGIEGAVWATAAAGAALRYVRDTQKTDASHVDRLSRVDRGQHLLLDEATLANLEVARSLREGGRKGSLLGVIDRTATGMGARKLARWLTAPLRSLPEIEARQEAVEELSQKGVVREELTATLKQVSDLERLCGRLSLAAGNARDLRAVATSLAVLPRLSDVLDGCDAPLLKGLCGPLRALPDLAEVLVRAIVDEPPAIVKDGGFIRQGFDKELDGLVEISTHGKDVLLRIEQRERDRTGIPSLKVRYNKVFGYYLEVTRSHLDKVPEDYQRKQTTVGAERFVTPELKEYEEKVLTAEEKRCALEVRLFEELRAQVVSRAGALRACADALATCDVLLSFARAAAEHGYVRPQMDDGDALEIEDGRHPVVERVLGPGEFVPNDVSLDRTQSQLLIITGPNMAGKSTVMRQVALTVLLAQAGSFVPARRARIGVCDRIFTRVGAADNLARGQSTFMVEMTETSNILHHATKRSLVVLDEIGRGTSTFDGLSIAWAVAEHLHDRIGARTLFATHYHELVDLAREKPRVKNCQVAVKEVQGKVVFLRKLVAGGASRSYGIEVARLAGLPPEVVGRAREILANLESGELDDAGHPRLTQKKGYRQSDASQLGLFVQEPAPRLSIAAQNALTVLKDVSIETTTPLEALNLLAKLKNELS